MWPFDRSTDETPESDADTDTDDEPIDLTPDDEPDQDAEFESVTVGEAYDETVPDENPSVNANHRTGAKIGNAISGALGTFLGNITLTVTRLTPGSLSFWRGMLKASYKGIRKSTGADVLAHVAMAGEIKHVPLEYDYEEGRYKTMDDEPEWWETSGEYQDRYHVGQTPTVFCSAQSNDIGDHVQAEVSKALDLGQDEYLYENAQVRNVEVRQPDPGANARDAIADGGSGEVTGRTNQFVTVEQPGTLSDRVVDLTWGDADGRVVSMDDYHETYPSTADPKKMDEERQIGRLMERDGDMSNYAFKMLLVAGAIVVGALAVVFIGPELFGATTGGGGGGGGGSMIPLMIDSAVSTVGALL